MPRATNARTVSTFAQFQKQAREVLASLRNELRSKEAELQRLKREEAQLAGLLGPGMNGSTRAAAGASGKSDGRINWSSVLEQLPKQFRASDIRKVERVKDRRSSELYAAITR